MPLLLFIPLFVPKVRGIIIISVYIHSFLLELDKFTTENAMLKRGKNLCLFVCLSLGPHKPQWPIAITSTDQCWHVDMPKWCWHVHTRLHCFILTKACSCRLEQAYFARKYLKINWSLRAIALPLMTELKKTTAAMAEATSLNKRFNEQNNDYARAL